MDSLKELLKHPGWEEYLDVIEGEMARLFMELFQLEPSKPEAFVKFLELKSKLDQLRNITYYVERELASTAEQIEAVDASYGKRFLAILKGLWRS